MDMLPKKLPNDGADALLLVSLLSAERKQECHEKAS